MKSRSVKLKEAHKNNNGVSNCSLLWGLEAQHLVTSSSSDTSIAIHDPLVLSNPPKLLRHHKDGVTVLALSPNSTCLASGSLDHSVKLYKFPGGEFQTNVTRFTLPIRSLAFSKSGSMLAAAGDDEGIKLINTVDGTIARILKGHKGPVTCLAFDPNGSYLASIDSVGTVIIWELCSGSVLHNLRGVAPDYGSDTSVLNVLSWSPNGDLLAVPGSKGDVVMYDRDTAEKIFSLRGEHEQSVCFLSWSPNGKYIATSGLDRQVLIWNVDKKQDMDRQKFEDRICCMAWKPSGNALAVIDVTGKYGVWESAVPSFMTSPTDGVPSLKSNNNGLLLFDEDTQEPSVSGSMSDAGEDSFGESELISRKRLRRESSFDKMLDDDNDNQRDLLPKVEPRKKSSRMRKESFDDGNEEVGSVMKSGRTKMQDAFQPGSTPVQAGKRRFLCYNMLGSITTMENDGYFHIEVDFHDTGRGSRVPSMTDYFGFTMASLNENGSVFANPCKGEKNLSTLMYRPFSSWANNSEWSMRFEEEEVKAVALGTGWVAAVTSLNFLRIFTEGGLQKHVLSLDGPVVTASGFKDELAVVTHASCSLPSNDQMLDFRVFNILNGTQPIKGRLPLTPGSCLTWLGYSDEGRLSSFDSKGVLRVFTNQYGGSWLPVFSNEKKSEENYWVVGLNESKLFCIVCKSPDTYPMVNPKPVLTLLSLSFPLASSDLGANDLENEFMLSNLNLSQTHKRIEEMAAAGLDTTSLDDDAFTMETSLDRCILRLIAACCNGDKLMRATELVRLLTLEKSVKGAIKLVTALKLPVLAERFNSILEERLLTEAAGMTPSSSNLTSNGVTAHEIPSVAQNRRSESAVSLPPPKLPSPMFSKQEKGQSRVKVEGESIEQSRNTLQEKIKLNNQFEVHHEASPSVNASNNKDKPSLSNSASKTTGERKTNDNGDQVQLKASSNPFAKASSNPFAKTSSNPFAKAASNAQSKPSLFDSMKKAKTGDGKN